MYDEKPHKFDRFQTTRWSVVLRAGADTSSDARTALEQLIHCYMYPLYAFSRRRGSSHHDAQDLTQGFFTHLLQGNSLCSLSPDKGRFRSFLLASFRNYIANEHRGATTLRRGGAVETYSLTYDNFQVHYDREPVHEETPEMLFERSWVEELLARVRDRLANDYLQAGKQQLFELLEPHLANFQDALPRSEICQRLNLSTAALAMSIHRMRRQYGELLRDEVAATVDDPADIDDELRSLMTLVRSR